MSDTDTQAALREMAGQIGALGANVKTLTDNWRAQDEKASLGRRDLHAKIDAALTRFQTIENTLAAVKEDVEGMKPTFEEVKAAKQRAIGAFWLSRFIYATAVVLAAGLPWVLTNWIKVSIR